MPWDITVHQDRPVRHPRHVQQARTLLVALRRARTAAQDCMERHLGLQQQHAAVRAMLVDTATCLA